MEVQQHLRNSGESRGIPASRPTVLFERADRKEERLPFTVRIARTEDELSKAVDVRHSAYMRHVPTVGKLLKDPERYDRDPACVVFVAESKFDGTPLGTIRLHTNLSGKLPLEESVTLPDWLTNVSRAEATRLGVSEGRTGTLVKTALFKAYFQYCLSSDIEWIVMAARFPLDRTYQSLLFRDVFQVGEYIPMRHIGDIAHRVLALQVPAVETNWGRASHPLYNFFFRTSHPDIDIGG